MWNKYPACVDGDVGPVRCHPRPRSYGTRALATRRAPFRWTALPRPRSTTRFRVRPAPGAGADARSRGGSGGQGLRRARLTTSLTHACRPAGLLLRRGVGRGHGRWGRGATDATVGAGGPSASSARLVLLDQVRDWCADSRTKLNIKPVIDLNTDLHTDAYEIPDRIREIVILRDRTCVFPWCTRPARGCDLDHVIEFDRDAAAQGRPQPGPTRTDNLAALCRTHHRIKTHTAWRYRMTAPGVFEWTSPHGHRYRRDRTGTSPIEPSAADPPGIPRPRRP